MVWTLIWIFKAFFKAKKIWISRLDFLKKKSFLRLRRLVKILALVFFKTKKILSAKHWCTKILKAAFYDIFVFVIFKKNEESISLIVMLILFWHNNSPRNKGLRIFLFSIQIAKNLLFFPMSKASLFPFFSHKGVRPDDKKNRRLRWYNFPHLKVIIYPLRFLWLPILM